MVAKGYESIAVAPTSRSVDSVGDLQHPRSVLPLIRPLVAVLSVLSFASGGWAQSAGWKTAAEARRACCTNG